MKRGIDLSNQTLQMSARNQNQMVEQVERFAEVRGAVESVGKSGEGGTGGARQDDQELS